MNINCSTVRKRQRSISGGSNCEDDDYNFALGDTFHVDEERNFTQSCGVKKKRVKIKESLTPLTPQYNIGYNLADMYENDGNSFFVIYINGKVSRVDAAEPFVNTKKLFGQAGILLQDVTIPKCPLLLLPCPHTGNVTVHPRRFYRLMKFIGEHLCLAGCFQPVMVDDNNNNNNNDDDENNNNNNNDILQSTQTLSLRDMKRERKKWAMSELMGMMAFLRSNPQKTPEDFMALPLEEAAIYHSVGNMSLPGHSTNISNSGGDDDEEEEEEDLMTGRESDFEEGV